MNWGVLFLIGLCAWLLFAIWKAMTPPMPRSSSSKPQPLNTGKQEPR